MKDQPLLTYANFIGMIVFVPLLMYLMLKVNQELGRMSIALNLTTAKYFSIIFVPQIGVTFALLVNAAVAFARYMKLKRESLAVYFSHSYSFAILPIWLFLILAFF